MKIECPRCGALEDSRWIWSGLCVDCFLSPETWIEPATCVPGASVQRAECSLCGAVIDVAGTLVVTAAMLLAGRLWISP